MNQILLTNDDNLNRKSNNENKSNNGNNIRTILIVFCILIMIFGIGIVILGVCKDNKDNKQEISAIPELLIEQEEYQAKIIAKSQIGIDKIVYTWNDEEPIIKNMNGIKDYEEQLDVPQGNSTLYVQIIDLEGKENTIKRDFEIESTNKPVITAEIQPDARLKITATVEEGEYMAYLTYKWNSEEETTVRAGIETDTVVETIIDVKRGENVLTVTAVNSKGVSDILKKKFNGVNNPIIKVSKDGNKLNMNITHDIGFEKVEFYINGQTYVYDKEFAGYDATKQELDYSFDLIEGENVVIIVATSIEGTQAIYQGKCDY